MIHIIPGWDVVEGYKARLSIEAIERAILEADKILIVIAKNAARHKTTTDEAVLQIGQGSGIDVAALREVAHAIAVVPRYSLSDMYRGMDILDRYEALLRYVLNAPVGVHDETQLLTRIKVRYCMYRSAIKKIALRLLIAVGVLLFVTDTPLGRALLYFVVSQIHALLIAVVFALLFAAIVFTLFVMFSLAVDALRKKTNKR